MSIENRLRRVVGSVFGIADGAVTDEASPRTIEAWDSVAHIQLVPKSPSSVRSG
jgi:hypothetical protein